MRRQAIGAWSSVTIRRQLLNFGGRSVDFRMGEGVLDDLSRLCRSAVGRPRLALAVFDGTVPEGVEETVGRSLVDAGFDLAQCRIAPEDASLDTVGELLRSAAGAGVTTEDLIVCMGAAPACSVASTAARLWLGGTQSLIIPTTLDAMVCAATACAPLDAPGSAGMVSLRPEPTMVACDLALASPFPGGLGAALLAQAALVDSTRSWERHCDGAAAIVDGDAALLGDVLASAQTARRAVFCAANPSARAALDYGVDAARALRSCLGDMLDWGTCLAEGMRFEARVAVDASSFDPECVFAQDDCLYDLGLDEAGFELGRDAFLDALRAERFRRANRMLLALPKSPGTVRLTSVDDDLLAAHAEAYLASRAEILSERG